MNQKSEQTAKEIASMLLKIKAIRLNVEKPFQWSSGWKSPIYCDNRLSLSFPEVRNYIKHALADAIKEQFIGVEAIAGVATAGIPQGALVADVLGLPFIYVRSKPKGHGMENMIEGLVTPGHKVVVLEDLVSTGGSSLKAVEALRAAEFEVLGMAAIFTYGFDLAQENFAAAKVPFICLSNYEIMLKEALKESYINEAQVATLTAWRKDPATWGN
ncbi:orotate phosphoribosyltransferase [Penaeicola halotolerans]|uniref:orotate phosphoribosyltransferase n=1 Tax=Penaeicola halotolerans TaxID=2793196 RepID=UPI001CF84078|nr:orotate phosphoribosyltransferase [Penaeicola halotolerans]